MIVYLVLLILSSLSQNFIEESIKKKERNFPHVNNKTFLEGFKKKNAQDQSFDERLNNCPSFQWQSTTSDQLLSPLLPTVTKPIASNNTDLLLLAALINALVANFSLSLWRCFYK